MRARFHCLIGLTSLYIAFATIQSTHGQIADVIYHGGDLITIDSGLCPSNHTDFVVAPLDQMFMLWSAVNCISRGGMRIGPDQRIAPLEGLKAMTIWVAEQYGEQELKGSLRVDPLDIKEIAVLETIKEGRSIYVRK